MVADETTIPERAATTGAPPAPRTTLVLVVTWCAEEPWRVGEVLLAPPGATVWFGRGLATPGQPEKTPLGQLRPGQWLPSPALAVPAVSRYQISLEALAGERLRIRNVGRCSLAVNDAAVDAADVGPGDLVQLGQQMLFVCARRSLGPAAEPPATLDFPYGGPDRQGIVGESQAIWELRQSIAQVATKQGHVLITGQSGSGKELVAQAIHALSPRNGGRLVTRNAATLPEGLIDAELFGNCRNYPNPGMAERPGLIGGAHLSSLLLDEFAELPQSAQAHLLRVLDAGEYHRLGESQTRVSDFRLIAATNRPLSALKPDLLARLTFHVAVPDLEARREDLPLLADHLLRTSGDFPVPPRLSLQLARQLLRHPFHAGMRELRSVLWQSMADPPSTRPSRSPLPCPESREAARSSVPSVDDVQRCLDQNNGVIEATWRALGLRNRFALLRLVKRYDLEVRRRPGRRWSGRG